MKGDFTRFTFQPQKHYSSVLMQQGRLQLDADWNEQMSILNYLNQIQTRDIIGTAAGTSQLEGGYQVLPAIDRAAASSSQSDFQSGSSQAEPSQPPITDLLITEGRFYIDGILCELNRGTPVGVERRSSRQIQVPAVLLDGRLLTSGQWIELEIPQTDRTQIKLTKIIKVSRDSLTLDLQDDIPEPQQNQPIRLRLLTTYTTQADYPNPPIPAPEAIYAVYLDVWQRHVTVLDDRLIQEVALNGLDTTTRLQTIAQVKLLDITSDLKTVAGSDQTKQAIDFDIEKMLFRSKPSVSDLSALPVWQQLNKRAVAMTATTASNPNSPIDLSGNYLGGDNRLYRVEIHRSGPIDEATFKWSRDNGSIVSAIEKIEGDVVYLKGAVQDEYKLFGDQSLLQSKENPWVEILTEAQELNNQPGILVRIRDVKPPNLLLLDMSQIQGATLPTADATEAAEQKLKARRWDGQSGTISDWQSLEQGIQVQFAADAAFITGDYWLISARQNRPIDWIRDLPQPKQQLGRPIAQPPVGIDHRYGILAVIKTESQNGKITFISPIEQDDPRWTQADLRTQFLPLIDRGTAAGIGVQQPEATFHVRGENSRTATGKIRKISDTPPAIEISDTEARLFRGYQLSIGDKTVLVTEASGTSVLRLTLDAPFDSLPADQETVTFRYQQPVIRFETQTASAPQFFLSSTGTIGINTFSPAAALEIRSTAADPAIDLLQIKTAAGNSLLQVQPDGKVNLRNPAGVTLLTVQPDGKVGVGVDVAQANLDVQNTLKITGAASSVQIQPQNDFIQFTSDRGYRFNQPLTIVSDAGGSGFLTVQPQISDAVRFTANAGYRFNTATSAGFFKVKPQDNEAIEFTSNQGYRFDKAITVDSGAVTVMNGNQENVKLTQNGVTVADGKVTVTKGDVEIKDGVLNIGGFIIDKTGITSDDTTFNRITVRNRINFGGALLLEMRDGTPRFSPPVTFGDQVTFDDPATFGDRVTIQRNGLTVAQGNVAISDNLTVSQNLTVSGNLRVSGNNSNLNVADGATIGEEYLPQPGESPTPAPTNGLLVQGHMGIGLFTAAPNRDLLLAKLQVQGAQPQGPIGDRAGVLNVTNPNNRSLLCVRNDGFVGIGTNDGTAPLGDNIPQRAKDEGSKLYVRGNTFVDGKLFARNIAGNAIEQVSTQTLKENIVELSSQEAANLLKQLNPVKFNYIFPDDRTDHAGFIAEEVPPLLASADRQAVRLLDIVAVLTKTIKDQHKGIAMLNQMVKQQQAAINSLTQKVNQLENQQS